MKISVVTAVFNRTSTIAEAMKSVQAQCYGDVEHVIQDGGSTDGTLEEISRLATNRPRLSIKAIARINASPERPARCMASPWPVGSVCRRGAAFTGSGTPTRRRY